MIDRLKALPRSAIKETATYYRIMGPWFLVWLASTVGITALFSFMSLDLPLMFYDWYVFFDHTDDIPYWYVPWTKYILEHMNLPLLLGMTIATYIVAVIIKSKSIASAVCACLTLPLFWTLYLGQLDGLALLGVLGMPLLVPLALVKPQVTAFAVFARQSSILVASVFAILIVALWGKWITKPFSWQFGSTPGKWPQDISLGLWGLPLFALLIWKMPKDDADWWMLAGSTITLRLIPYNLVVLMPAAARLHWPWTLAVALTSWLPLLANWLGAWAWKLGWVSVGVLAVGLAMRGEHVVEEKPQE